jgi:predicted nucleic acid-binding protein
MNTVILDSSVIAKWLFPTENDSALALKIKEDFAQNKITISVPVLLFYEINNLLRTAVKRFRIDEKEAKLVYASLLNLNFVAHSSKELFESALEKAMQLDISSYDGSYLALAESLDVPFYTSDEKLLSKAKSDLVKDLKQYSLPRN